jgi:hypothetical protein
MQARKDHKSLINVNWTVDNEYLQARYDYNFAKSVSKEKTKKLRKKDSQNSSRVSKVY